MTYNLLLIFLFFNILLTTKGKCYHAYKITTTSGNEIIGLLTDENVGLKKMVPKAYIGKKEGDTGSQKILWLDYSNYLKKKNKNNILILFIVDEQLDEPKKESKEFKILAGRFTLALTPGSQVEKVEKASALFEFDQNKRNSLSDLKFDNELKEETETNFQSILTTIERFFRWFIGGNENNTTSLKGNMNAFLKAKLEEDRFFREGQTDYDKDFDDELKKHLCRDDIGWVKSRKVPEETKRDPESEKKELDDFPEEEQQIRTDDNNSDPKEEVVGTTYTEERIPLHDDSKEDLPKTDDVKEEPVETDDTEEEETPVHDDSKEELPKEADIKEKMFETEDIEEELLKVEDPKEEPVEPEEKTPGRSINNENPDNKDEERPDFDKKEESPKFYEESEHVAELLKESGNGNGSPLVPENKKQKNGLIDGSKRTKKLLWVTGIIGVGLFLLFISILYKQNTKSQEYKNVTIKQSRITKD